MTTRGIPSMWQQHRSDEMTLFLFYHFLSLLNFILAIFYSCKGMIPNSLRSFVPEQSSALDVFSVFFSLTLSLLHGSTHKLYNLFSTTAEVSVKLNCNMLHRRSRRVITGQCEGLLKELSSSFSALPCWSIATQCRESKDCVLQRSRVCNRER